MTHKHHVDRHVSVLRAQHGASAKQTRRWLRVGFLPGIGEEPAIHHKRPVETLPDALRRMLRDLPPFTTRADFSAFRARLVAAAAVKLLELPEERVRQAVAVLQGEGVPATMENVFELAGGDRPRITAALRRLSPQLPGVLERRIMAAALMEAHQLAAFVRSDLVPELAGELADRNLDVDPDAVGADLPRRFDAWAPKRFDFQQVVDLGVMRSAVQLPWTADNPAGAIDPAIDFMLRHGETPTVSSMRTLIGGGREQLARHLTRRAREKGDVPLPKRLSRDACDVEDLRDALPAEMRDLFNTALDMRRGGPRDDIKPHAIGRVIANPHAQLQVVAAVATLHGPRTKALKRKAGKAAIAAGNLGPALHGVDIANPAEIAAGFTAIRLTLRSLPDRHDAPRAAHERVAQRVGDELGRDQQDAARSRPVDPQVRHVHADRGGADAGPRRDQGAAQVLQPARHVHRPRRGPRQQPLRRRERLQPLDRLAEQSPPRARARRRAHQAHRADRAGELVQHPVVGLLQQQPVLAEARDRRVPRPGRIRRYPHRRHLVDLPDGDQIATLNPTYK